VSTGRRVLAVLFIAVGLAPSGCANFIRESDAVVPDVVPGTERASIDELRVEGAIATGRLRFTCQKQLFAVTNTYETPYVGSNELYEVPVGLIAFAPALLWYVVVEIGSLSGADWSGASAPLHWASAGLNPFLPVENGMFEERYAIRRKPGSQRPQEGSVPEPYDAVVPPKSPIGVAFEGGSSVDVELRDEVGVTINLLEVARVIPGPDAQRIDLDVRLEWNPSAPPVQKSVPVYIDRTLSESLWALREASRTAIETTSLAERRAALAIFAEAGFSREAAMLRDTLPSLGSTLLAPEPAASTRATPKSNASGEVSEDSEDSEDSEEASEKAPNR
jgi:hypothetical protein